MRYKRLPMGPTAFRPKCVKPASTPDSNRMQNLYRNGSHGWLLTALAAFMVVGLVSDSGESAPWHPEEPGFFGLSAPPDGLPDTEEAGRDQALRDLSRGELLIGLRGDVEYTAFARYEALGLRAVALGCVKGDYGSNFWRGYNKVASQHMRTAAYQAD